MHRKVRTALAASLLLGIADARAQMPQDPQELPPGESEASLARQSADPAAQPAVSTDEPASAATPSKPQPRRVTPRKSTAAKASPSTAVPATSRPPARSETSRTAKSAHHYRPERFAGRAGTYYRVVWGIDSLSVKWAESGEVVRFSYQVLDAERAKLLSDKAAEPSLIDPRAGVSLVVPAMENVGKLRQTAAPQNGKSYWMVFSNKGRPVKRGDRVNVVIGTFHADGLVVD
jgi:hypothetical protein